MYYWIMLGVFLYLLWAVQGAEEKIAKEAGTPVPFVYIVIVLLSIVWPITIVWLIYYACKD